MKVIVIFVIFIFHLEGLRGYEVDDSADAMAYLAKFGYITENELNGNNLVDVSTSLMEFQDMFGIKVTGKLDKDTLKAMNMPRCGNKDMNSPTSNRTKRFSVSEFKWKKRDVSYRISEYSRRRNLDRSQVDQDIDKAFNLWQAEADIQFIRVGREVDANIDIQFVTGDHGDRNHFDGPGRVLAHAFYPGEEGLLGDVHFDDDEPYTTGTPQGINVLQVAVHEIGHALGLQHSKVKGSIMAPSYGGYNSHLQLHPDDIQGIQTLYGPRRRANEPSLRTPTSSSPRPDPRRVDNEPRPRFAPLSPRFGPRFMPIPENEMRSEEDMKTTTTTSSPQTPSRESLCEDPRIDAITTLPDGSIMIFKGRYVYRLGVAGGLINEDIRLISSLYDGLESDVDAAFTSNGRTYIFKGSKYWRYSRYTLDRNYPKEIGKNFPGIPDNIDAVFEWPRNKFIYFFKGDKFWAFNRFQKPPVSSKYPQPIADLSLPSSIEAVCVMKDKTILVIKRGQYWRLNDYELKPDDEQRRCLKACASIVAQAEPPYPRDIRTNFLQCSGARSRNQRL